MHGFCSSSRNEDLIKATALCAKGVGNLRRQKTGYSRVDDVPLATT